MAKFRIYNLKKQEFILDDEELGYAYEANTEDLRRVRWPEEALPPFSIHLKIPAAAKFPDSTKLDIKAPVAASEIYEGVTYTALMAGDAGNSIVLSFDGVQTIAEVVSDSGLVSHDAPDDTVVPSAGSITLQGGADEKYSLKVDPIKLREKNQKQNVESRRAQIQAEEAKYSQAVNAALPSPADPNLGVPERIGHLFTYIDALQAAAGINDSALSTEGQSAKAALQGIKDAKAVIEAAKAARDAALADLSGLPNASDGLPADYDDPYLP